MTNNILRSMGFLKSQKLKFLIFCKIPKIENLNIYDFEKPIV